MKIKSFISILLIAVLITITGCSNEEEKNQALAKSLDANQKIETSKAKGYQEWAPDEFATAEAKLQVAEKLASQGKYKQAQLAYEDFQVSYENAQLIASTKKENARKEADELSKLKQEELLLAETEAQKAAKEELAAKKLTVQKFQKPHRVRKGDCLWNIAKNTYGDPFKWAEIYEANKDSISNPHIIEPGQVFKLPILK
mgnify:CR=1 FL=1|jgi:nucleoid-associated protein YgaU